MKAQTIWEYKYVYMKSKTDSADIEGMLNDMGSQGWELTSVIGGSGDDPFYAQIHSYIFKRPKL
ncbi:MAG: DUF4177 domain-containing protein [Candidatus Heimdallarchaeaceae archaeon]